MLGQERTVSELVTIVDEYSTKDLDDVKLGILSHLAQFFEVSMDGQRWIDGWIDMKIMND